LSTGADIPLPAGQAGGPEPAPSPGPGIEGGRRRGSGTFDIEPPTPFGVRPPTTPLGINPPSPFDVRPRQ
jgi:hypothetical protein